MHSVRKRRWTPEMLLEGWSSALASCTGDLHRTPTAGHLDAFPSFLPTLGPTGFLSRLSLAFTSLEWHNFLLPSHFSWPFHTHKFHSPFCFRLLHFSFVFLSAVLTWLIFFWHCFYPGLFFLSVFWLAALSSATHKYPLHLFSFLPWSEIYLLFPSLLPSLWNIWNKRRTPSSCCLSALFQPNSFSLPPTPPLIFSLSHQRLVAFGLLIVFNILNEAHNFC